MSCSLPGPLNPMWKNAKIPAVCCTCGKEFLHYKGSGEGKFCSRKCVHSNPEWRIKQRDAKVGKKMTDSARIKMSKAGKGKPKSDSHRAAMAAANKQRFIGHKSILPEYERIRSSAMYREWQSEVFKRDRATCQDCGEKPKKIDSHHIIPFSILVQEFLMGFITEEEIHFVENGITLCRECHLKRHEDGFTPVEILLLRQIRKLWKRNGSTGDFSKFYENEMQLIINSVEALINSVKDQLDQ